MVLDTLIRQIPATKLYAKPGFLVTEPYYHIPLEGVVFMQKSLL